MNRTTLTLLLTTTALTTAIHATEADGDMPDDCVCTEMFEDLTLGTSYANGDSFVSRGVMFEVTSFQWSSGDIYTGGHVLVDNMGSACGTGQDIVTNNANVNVLFPDSTVIDVYWTFGEYGGNINLSINGDDRNVDNYRDLDGMLVGGVVVNVLSGGWGDDCGCVRLDGAVTDLQIGGQEHAIDCLMWCCEDDHDNPAETPGGDPGDDDHDDADSDDDHGDHDDDADSDDDHGDHADDPRKQGDVNHDGLTNLTDLLELVAKYGTDDPDADLDLNGIVDMPDLIETLIGMHADATQP